MNLRDLALTPRATAVLVALRKGPRSIGSIADAIGDATTAQTRELLQLMVRGIDGDCVGPQLVLMHVGHGRWGLTHDGLGWLQSHGIDASESAKQALYAATDAQAVRA